MTQIVSPAPCTLRIEANGPRTCGMHSGRPGELHQVAQEFESLLIDQILKSMKLGEMSGDDNGASTSMMGIAQEHLARVISQNGGLGVGQFLERSLDSSTALNQSTASSRSNSEPGASGPLSSVISGNQGTTSATALGIALRGRDQ